MAKAATQSQFEQVTTLYEERQRFEAWLSALEAKRATTPVHIYTRVHADYGARLQRVVEELRTHRTALQETESTLIDRLTALDSEEAKHRDEAAEAELRATVGELGSAQFDEVTQRTSGAIATLSEERARVQAEHFCSASIASVNQLNLGIRKRKAHQTPPPAYDPVHTEHDALAVDVVHPRLGQHHGAAFVRHPHAGGALLGEVQARGGGELAPHRGEVVHAREPRG